MSTIDDLGNAIADASITWTPFMRKAWDRAKSEEDKTLHELKQLRKQNRKLQIKVVQLSQALVKASVKILKEQPK